MNILIVDDDADFGVFLKAKLSREAPHFSVAVVECGAECIEFIRSRPVDCVLSDYRMPDMDGMELLASLRNEGNHTPFIFLTGQGNEEVAREAFKSGAYDYFTKDTGFPHLPRIIDSIEQAVRGKAAEALDERDALTYALRESEERLRTLFESADDGIFVQDDGVFVDCNTKAVEMYGFDGKSDVIGHHPMEFAPPFQPDGMDSKQKALHFINAALNGSPQKFYWQTYRKDRTLLDVEVSLNTFRLKGKTYIQAIVRDITERKELENQREHLLEILRHDMKTPLTVIMGSAEFALSENDGTLSDNIVQSLHLIHASSRVLSKLLEDQVIIFNIESGGLKPRREKVDVGEILTEVSRSVADLARQKDLTFEKNIPGGLPPLLVDRLCVLRAVTNLAQNAVNYTPAGGNIKLSAWTSATGEEECVYISVSDDGTGIPAAEKEKVFEKYHRSANARNVNGSGLGLAIVKAVAEAHGGRVELDSEAGKGSDFRLILPVTAGPKRGGPI